MPAGETAETVAPDGHRVDPSHESSASITLKDAAQIAAGFTILALLMTYPLVRHFGRALPSDIGDPALNTWILAWDADRLWHGLRGFWDAPVLYPYRTTLAHTEHLLGIALFTAPVSWLTGNPVAAYNFGFLLSYVLAGTGMYLLAYEICHRRDAALVAALAFAFAPYRVDHPGHLQVLMSGWMPVGLWALHRYFRAARDGAPAPRRRWLWLFALAFVLQAFSNGYFLYFFSVALGLVVLWELVQLKRARGRAVAELVAAGICILLALAPVVSAYYNVRRERGHTRKTSEMESYSASVSSYARVSRRVVLWRHVLNGGRGERQLFPGLTVSVLAVIAAGGLIRKRSTPPVSDPRQRGLTALYVVLALLAFVLSLGPRLQFDGFSLPGPYGWLIAVVPGMNALRVTARIAILVYLALSVLAAVGASHVLARVRSVRFVAVALGVAVIAEGFSWGVHVVAFDPRGLSQDRLAYEWLRGRPAGGMLELPVLGRRTARSVLKFQFAALAHRHPIVNGYIGYSSALQRFLGGPASPLNDLRHMDETVAALRSLDVRYIALHRRDWPDRQQADATARAIDAVAGQIEDRETFAETSIWQLAAWPAERPGLKDEELVPVATSHLQASAAPAADRIRFAFDGNPDTRWISGRRQRGNERVQIQLDRKRNLERLVLEMDVGTLGDYPRELIVESSSEDGVFRVLYRGPVLRQLIHGLIRDGNHPLIEIDLPSNETLTLRLRQTGEASTWFWSIPELRLLERKGR